MVKDLITRNRSYRGYDESYKFSRDQLLDYVDGARLCASSINIQPLKYYIAFEKDDVDKIQSRIRWARQLPDLRLPHPGMCPTAFIVICQDKDISDNLNRFTKDIGIVAQSILLMAVEEGLGGCMIGNFSAGDIHDALNLSENLHPMLVIALGKPAETVILTEVGEDGDTAYYRDENDIHYVPKRALEDLLIN
ncbi:MAG: nitroreductase family protein [Eubacterium sp.]|nr:nitroreductase family protein [Eubacterium sp.]